MVTRRAEIAASAIVLTGSCFANTAAFAEALGFGDWQGSIELRADYSKLEVEPADPTAPSAGIDNLRTEERLTIRNNGAHLLSPRLVRFNVGGTFGLAQESSDVTSGDSSSSETRDADLSGYDFLASFLPNNQTLSLNLFSNLNKYIQTRELAGRTDVETEQLGATLFARRLIIPSTLSVRREMDQQLTRTGPAVTGIDEDRDILTYEGRRGWINGQMSIRYQFIDKTDDLRPELDFKTQDANLSTSIDAGPELNWHWDSRIRSYSRENFSEEDRIDIDQFLNIEHSDRLRTQYRYFYTDADRPEGRTTSQTGSFSLNHRLYDSLDTNVQADVIDDSFDDGGRKIYRGRTSFSYTKQLPLQGRLTAGFAVSTATEEDDFDEAFVSRELHPFDVPIALSVALDEPNVIQGSIEVIKVVNGLAVPGCGSFPVPIPLVEGVDYLVQVVGTTTEIVPLPCTLTSPGISGGDTISVDYRFTRGGEPVEFRTNVMTSQASLDYGWIRPFFTFRKIEQDLLSGSDSGFLSDETKSVVGLELRYENARLDASLQFESENLDSDDQAYEELRMHQFIRYNFSPGLWLTVNGRQSARDFSFPDDRKTDLWLMRSMLTYAATAGLYASAFASVQNFEDTVALDQRTAELGVRVRWWLGKLEVNPSLSVIDIERGTSDSREYRFVVQITRRFF